MTAFDADADGKAVGCVVVPVGDFVVVHETHDRLRPEALSVLSAEARTPGCHGGREPDGPGSGPVDVLYADHEVIDPCATERAGAGEHPRIARKPAWSPERLRHQDYTAAPVMIRRSLFDEVGGLGGPDSDPSIHDLVLRAGERARRIVHVPHVLLDRNESERRDVDVTPGAGRSSGSVSSTRPVSATGSRTAPVSVVIPTRGSSGEVWGVERCFVTEAVRSIVERSSAPVAEIVVVADADTPPAVLASLSDIAGETLVVVGFDGPFNFSEKIDAGVCAASSDLLLLLNDDTELVDPDSIGRLAATVSEPAKGRGGRWGDVGVAGARLLFDDGTLQHGGVVFNGFADHACRGWPGDTPGPVPGFPLAVPRETSAVTAAALMIRRDVYVEVGGMDPAFPLNFNDVDLCAAVRSAGHRIVYRPDACWYHFESRTRTARVLDSETALVDRRWFDELRHDPYYHPALIPGHFDWREADGDVRPAPRSPGVFTAAVTRNVRAVRARSRR